jgi:uncharacterized metal-binding protein
MKYDDPECAYCPPTVRACRQGEAAERGPGFCPSQVDPDTQAHARAAYDDPETRRIAHESALVESEGYCKWTRVEEIVQFAKRMGFRKIGIANCISFVDHAYVLSGIFESHGFEVVSVACKNGNVPKEEMGVADHEKIRPGQFEALCNPVSQAELLNAHGCELNVVMGLCVGHDSLFFKHAQGLTTVLVAKDRVSATTRDGAPSRRHVLPRVWGPSRPSRPSSARRAARRRVTPGPLWLTLVERA